MNVYPSRSFFVLFLLSSFALVRGEVHRVGRRQKGDTVLFEKTISTDWTTDFSEHNLTYEYSATEPVTSIEYQMMETAKTEIIFSGENSILAIFSANRTRILAVKISVFGYHEQYMLQSAKVILYNMQKLMNITNQYDKYNIFSVGKRYHNDDARFYTTKRSNGTIEPATHSIDINIKIDYFVTCIEVLVNANSANVIFLVATDHTFHGIVSASDVRQLVVRLQIYGFVPKEVPMNYVLTGTVYVGSDAWEDNSTEFIFISNCCRTLCCSVYSVLFALYGLMLFRMGMIVLQEPNSISF